MQQTNLQKIKTFILGHKALSATILIIVIIGLYFTFRSKTTTETRYVTATIEKGTIVTSITGSGQVAATNSVGLTSKTSGTITYVAVKPGDLVAKGKTLFAVDATNAQKAARNAETALETAKLDLEKFKAPPKTIDVLALEAAITDAEKSKTDAGKDVQDALRTLLNSSIAARSFDNASTATPPTISGTYTKDTEAQIIINVHQAGNSAYFSISSVPVGIVTGTGELSTATPTAIGDSGLYIKFANMNMTQQDWLIDLPNKTVSNYASNLTAYTNALENQKKTIRDADLSIAQNKQKIADLYTPDALDLRGKELAVKEKEDSLADAQQSLYDCYIVAPFTGTIASVTGKVGETASGALATIITKQKLASITLNEVDVSKIQLGDKATLTFDAIDDLTMTGEVAEIDTVGTVTQGVVNYVVKISFDTDDDRIKPGMSVSAAIITDSKADVLIVPSGAIKTNANGSYIEMFNTPLADSTSTQGATSNTLPKQVPVVTGISNDTSTEIVSGIQEGDQIVSRTITTSTTKTATTSAPSLLGGSTTRGTSRTGSNTGFGGAIPR